MAAMVHHEVALPELAHDLHGFLEHLATHVRRRPAVAEDVLRQVFAAGGQRSPRMCSFRFSPLPTPRKKRPSSISDAVAAACATIAGWTRIIGQVTPVPSVSSFVAWAMPPITPHTNGLWPWVEIH